MTTQLLCTFSKPSRLNQTIEEIKSCYTLAFGKIYILENTQNSKELICSYNIDSSQEIVGDIPLNTISVHRKKDTNTIYTINALNYVISLLNDGKIDPKFPMPWDKYKNCILVTNNEGLKKIETKIHSVVKTTGE
jgi:hypothetical protein